MSRKGSFPMCTQHSLQIRGVCVDDFISKSQDRTRNAHSKSLQAAWNVWKELLQADQVLFQSEKIALHVRVYVGATRCEGRADPRGTISLTVLNPGVIPHDKSQRVSQ